MSEKIDLKVEELKNVTGGTYVFNNIVLYRCIDLLFAMPGFQVVIYSESLERIGIGTLKSNQLIVDGSNYPSGTIYFEFNGETYDFGTRPENKYHVGPIE